MGRSSAAIVVIVVGFVLLYIAVGGHYCCLSTFVQCLFGPTDDPACQQRAAVQQPTTTSNPTPGYQFAGPGGVFHFPLPSIPEIPLPGGGGIVFNSTTTKK